MLSLSSTNPILCLSRLASYAEFAGTIPDFAQKIVVKIIIFYASFQIFGENIW